MTWGNLAFVYSWMPCHEQEAGRNFAKAIDLAEQQRKLNPRDAFLHRDLDLYYTKTGSWPTPKRDTRGGTIEVG